MPALSGGSGAGTGRGTLSTMDNGARAKLDTGVPHSARLWNYWLGGKDNFAVDRQNERTGQERAAAA